MFHGGTSTPALLVVNNPPGYKCEPTVGFKHMATHYFLFLSTVLWWRSKLAAGWNHLMFSAV